MPLPQTHPFWNASTKLMEAATDLIDVVIGIIDEMNDNLPEPDGVVSDRERREMPASERRMTRRKDR